MIDTLPDAQAFQPLQHQPLKEAVFEFLHGRIIAGAYAPGDWLRQEEIAGQLGVSMTPVREALDLLVSSGLAERIPYRGVRVPRPSPGEIADAYAMRILLECGAAYAAALAISEEQIRELKALLEQTRTLVTLKEMSSQRQLNRRFHKAVVAASGNQILMRSYETVLNTFPDWRLYEYMFRHPELLDSSLEHEYREHSALVKAIAARNAERAAQQAARHILSRARELESYLEVPGELLRLRERQVAPLLKIKP